MDSDGGTGRVLVGSRRLNHSAQGLPPVNEVSVGSDHGVKEPVQSQLPSSTFSALDSRFFFCIATHSHIILQKYVFLRLGAVKTPL